VSKKKKKTILDMIIWYHIGWGKLFCYLGVLFWDDEFEKSTWTNLDIFGRWSCIFF